MSKETVQRDSKGRFVKKEAAAVKSQSQKEYIKQLEAENRCLCLENKSLREKYNDMCYTVEYLSREARKDCKDLIEVSNSYKARVAELEQLLGITVEGWRYTEYVTETLLDSISWYRKREAKRLMESYDKYIGALIGKVKEVIG